MNTTLNNKNEKNIGRYIFALTLILTNNLCFYTSDSVSIYIALSCIGMFIIWFFYLAEVKFRIVIGKYVSWITFIFVMFTLYGTLFLQKGIYNWDKMLFTYAQALTFYVCFKVILKLDRWWTYLFKSFSVSLIITLVYLVFKEGRLILLDASRIGSSLSGDVNVVADCMGILTLLVFYHYLQDRNRLAAILTPMVLGFMLLTGSKRVAFVIIIMLAMAWPYAKKKLNVLLIVTLIFVVGIYLVFESSFFYNLIGYRFIDMYMQLSGKGSTAYYTSTNARLGMIIEGFHIFLKKPIFGGGMGYYSSQSVTWGYYDYSHSNYIEMLCTFGLFGTLIYYLPYFRNIYLLNKFKKELGGASVVISMLVLMLFIDWVAVSFLEICIYYLPITLAFALLDVKKEYIKS